MRPLKLGRRNCDRGTRVRDLHGYCLIPGIGGMHNHSSTPPGQSSRPNFVLSMRSRFRSYSSGASVGNPFVRRAELVIFPDARRTPTASKRRTESEFESKLEKEKQHVVEATEDRGTKKHKKGSCSCKEKTYERPPAEIGAKRTRQAGVIGGQEKTMNPVGCRGCDLTRKQPVSNDGVWKTHGRRSHDPEQFECAAPFSRKNRWCSREKNHNLRGSHLIIICEPLRSRLG